MWGKCSDKEHIYSVTIPIMLFLVPTFKQEIIDIVNVQAVISE